MMEPYQQHHIRNGLMAARYALIYLSRILELDVDHPGYHYLHEALNQLQRIAQVIDPNNSGDRL